MNTPVPFNKIQMSNFHPQQERYLVTDYENLSIQIILKKIE